MSEFLAPDLILVVYIHIQADPLVTSLPCMLVTVCFSLSSTSLEASCQKLQVELEKAPKQQDIERYVLFCCRDHCWQFVAVYVLSTA